MTKQIPRVDLAERFPVILRRSNGPTQSVIHAGKIMVNRDTKIVEFDGARIHLTANEYATLELLCLHKGATLTKGMFLKHLYGGLREPEAKMVDVYICKLRKKLRFACAGESYIETVWGGGYALRDTKRPHRPRDCKAHCTNAVS